MRVLLVGTVLLVFVSYSFYVRFDEWTYLRYLLPAYPALLVLAVAGLQWMLSGGRRSEDVSRRLPAVAMVVACLVVAALTWRTAVERGLFDIKAFESRYERAARSVARLTPPTAVVFAMQHSGTLRYYGGRPTLRYDLVDRDALERTVAELTSAGYHPYFVLEDWEVQAFRDRFGHASASGRLERSPVARLWPRPAVFLYDAQDAATAPDPGATR